MTTSIIINKKPQAMRGGRQLNSGQRWGRGPPPQRRAPHLAGCPFGFCRPIADKYPQRASDESVGSVHSGLPRITSSTDDVSEERTRSSDLNSIRARGTLPRPLLSAAACDRRQSAVDATNRLVRRALGTFFCGRTAKPKRRTREMWGATLRRRPPSPSPS